ncbi:hypothetical protein BKA69DRAFT_1038386 [Paraphysoderma sedebokerense]|nr:hypothetical protein BKA69DRAFT_1038386 [Paraphysoderma sedebokerense]
MIFVSVVNNIVTIRREWVILLKDYTPGRQLYVYTIPQTLLLFLEISLGEISLFRYLYLLYPPKKSRIILGTVGIGIFIRIITHLTGSIFTILSALSPDRSRYATGSKVCGVIAAVFLVLNSIAMSLLFVYYYISKLKYARAHRKFLKILGRIAINHALVPTLFVFPLLYVMFIRSKVQIDIEGGFTWNDLAAMVMLPLFRFFYIIPIAYAMYLFNLGPRYFQARKINSREKHDAVEIVQAFREEKEPESIVEVFLKEIYLRLGAISGNIFSYTDDHKFESSCQFVLDVNADAADVAFDPVVEDDQVVPTSVLRLALKTNKTVIKSYDEPCDGDEEEGRDTSGLKKYAHEKQTRSIICVPLIDRFRSVFICIDSIRDVFVDTVSATDIYILELLCQQLIVTLENSRLFADLAKMNLELDRKVADRTEALEKQKLEIEQARFRAEECAKSKSVFLANMSHEVRTPASQILGATEMLSESSLTQEQIDYVKIINHSGKLLLNLLNDILDLSKLDSNKLKLEYSEFDLHQTVKISVEAFTVTKPLCLAYLVDDDLPKMVVGDAMRLQQIFTNLISNSIKFTEAGHIVLHTQTKLVSSGQHESIYDVTFAVTDTGIGIAPDRLEIIFQRFEQENVSISRAYGGTGLGLAISQELCGLMGTKLYARSELGYGSTFYFTLRLPSPTPHNSRLSNATHSEKRPHSNIKALLLYPNDNVLKFENSGKPLVQVQLENYGIQVSTMEVPIGTDTPDAVTFNLVSSSSYDFVVVDISTPSSDHVRQVLANLTFQLSTISTKSFIVLKPQTDSPDTSSKFVLKENQFLKILRFPYKQTSLIQAVAEVTSKLPEPSKRRRSITLQGTELTARKNLKILLAEDNIVNQKVLRAMFSKLGYQIDIANNGAEAVETVKEVDYDVIFMDVRLKYNEATLTGITMLCIGNCQNLNFDANEEFKDVTSELASHERLRTIKNENVWRMTTQQGSNHGCGKRDVIGATPAPKRWTVTFSLIAVMIFVSVVNNIVTIRREWVILLKDYTPGRQLYVYTIPQTLLLFLEISLGEISLFRYLYLLYPPKKSRIILGTVGIGIFIRIITHLTGSIFTILSALSPDRSRYATGSKVCGVIAAVFLVLNSIAMSLLFVYYYISKLKYARAHRKFLKILGRIAINHALVPTLFVFPLLYVMFIRSKVQIDIEGGFTWNDLAAMVMLPLFRFFYIIPIAYAMYLFNLGPRYFQARKINSREKHDAVEIVQAFREEKEPESIVEVFLKEIYLRLGAISGNIFSYTDDHKFESSCQFVLDVNADAADVAFDPVVEDDQVVPTSVLRLALKTNKTVIKSYDEPCDGDEEEGRDTSGLKKYAHEKQTRSIICVPLIDRFRSVFICIDSIRDVFVDTVSATDIYILELLCQQLIVTLENSRLFADLAKMNLELDRKVADRTEALEKQKLEIEQARFRAEECAKSKSVFLANMSHEVRTPASQILGATEMLSESSLTQEQIDYVKIINHSGKLLLNLLNDILDLSKLDSNKLKLEYSEFDLHQTVKISVEAFTVTKPLCLAYLVDDDLPKMVVGDAMRLQQIFTNLISNSIKFTEAGHIVLHTQTKLVSSGQHESIYDVTFAVTDTGIGIAPDRLEIIFQRFEQENVSISRAYGGTGLGLAISQELCGLMGTKLYARSELGYGSTFYFTLRLPSPTPHNSRLSNATHSEKRPHSNIKALLLYPNDNVLKFENSGKPLVQVQLENYGIQVSTMEVPIGTDTPDAVTFNLVSSSSYDFVVVDISTPSSDHVRQVLANLTFQLSTISTKSFIVLKPQTDSPDTSSKFVLKENQFLKILRFPYKQTSLIQAVAEVTSKLPEPSKRRRSITLQGTELTARKNLKILLAEDNIVNQKVLRAMFSKLGYQIDIANNGAEAVETVKEVDYDVIFMDVRMPIMSGLEATRLIKSHCRSDASRKAPIIIGLSADALMENYQDGLKAGMDGYLSKPVSKNTLVSILQKYFS